MMLIRHTGWNVLEFCTIIYSELVNERLLKSGFCELGRSLSESLSCAFRKGHIVLLIYVVLDCGQLVAWSIVSGGM